MKEINEIIYMALGAVYIISFYFAVDIPLILCYSSPIEKEAQYAT